MKNIKCGIRKTAVIMAMPVTVEVKSDKQKVTSDKVNKDVEGVFKYLRWVDEKFSPFKKTSEVSKYNRGEEYSKGLVEILSLCEKTKKQTNGYFDIKKFDGTIDPSGLVKGWAIYQGAQILKKKGYNNFFVDVAGDAEIIGKKWKWGIRNPFNKSEIVKVLSLSNCGIATSGTYERGQHVWNPITKSSEITDIISISVIGQNVYEADRFATAAFAMGRDGISFIESKKNLEGYMIDKDGVATYTTGFEKYLV